MPAQRKTSRQSTATADLGLEAKLWLATDKLCSGMDAPECGHVALGLIFLRYLPDSFEEHRARLAKGKGDYAGANPEDSDEYKAEDIFWIAPSARCSYLENSAKRPAIGKIVDDAMVAIERESTNRCFDLVGRVYEYFLTR